MILFAAIYAGGAAARHHHAYGAAARHPHRHYGHYAPLVPSFLPPLPQGLPPDEQDWFRFGFSGTRGRMGLGADPYHPEGPGNFSFPGR